MSVTNDPEATMREAHNRCIDALAAYGQTRDEAHLAEAFELARKAVAALPPGSPETSNVHATLGSVYRHRFQASLDRKELEAAIGAYEMSRDNARNREASRESLSDLSICYGNMHDLTGDVAWLTASVEAVREALRQTPRRHPKEAHFAWTAGMALLEHYWATGQADSLDAAIRTMEQQRPYMTPFYSGEATFLNNLGICYRNRYLLRKNAKDIDLAVDCLELSREKTEHDTDHYPIRLNNLGNCLIARFELHKQSADMLRGLSMLETAAAYRPAAPLERVSRLMNLAGAVNAVLKITKERAHLDRALALTDEALGLLPTAHARRPGALTSKAGLLLVRAAWDGSDSDIDLAFALFAEASEFCEARSAQAALDAARAWLEAAVEHRRWAEADTAYARAWAASEKLVRSQLARRDQEAQIGQSEGVALGAAYAYAMSGRPCEAVVAIERGQARLMSQALARNRADLDSVNDLGRSDLVEEYRAFSAAIARLECAALETAAELAALRDARDNLNRVVEDIRTLPGHAGFLQPSGLDEVRDAARRAPLIYIAVVEHAGLAVVVTTDARGELAYHVEWLPALTASAVKDILWSSDGVLTAYDAWLDAPDNAAALAGWRRALDRCGERLWRDLWVPLRAGRPGLEQATLIPIGLLGLLPLHAAWSPDATRATGKAYVSDAVTLSYSANARALVHARRTEASCQAVRLLAVDQPLPTELPILQLSAAEVALAAQHFPRRVVLRGHAATREAVLEALSDCDVLHLSCHGKANLAEPLRSGVLMAGDKLLTVEDILAVNLRGARLAMLSACEVGAAGTHLPEEVVSLPAGLIQAGFAAVVSPLWAVSQISALLLVARFYEACWREGETPAAALRTAQTWLRDSTNMDLRAWLGRARASALEVGFDRLETHLAGLAPDAREFRTPDHWAAFTLVGA